MGLGEKAVTVVVHVGVEVLLVEGIDSLGEAAGDRAIAEALSDHRSVLAFGQGIVAPVNPSQDRQESWSRDRIDRYK